MSKELILTVAKNDFDFVYQRGSGKGGQKRNKTSNAVRCTHKDSGATGYAEDTRSQTKNKHLAFERACATNDFRIWINRKIVEQDMEQERVRKLESALKQVEEILQGENACEISIDSNLNVVVDYS